MIIYFNIQIDFKIFVLYTSDTFSTIDFKFFVFIFYFSNTSRIRQKIWEKFKEKDEKNKDCKFDLLDNFFALAIDFFLLFFERKYKVVLFFVSIFTNIEL